MDDDRRAHRRHGVLIDVRVRDEEKLRALYATDLSKGGLFVATRSEMPVGQRLEVVLVHPLTEATQRIACEVANVRRDPGGQVRGCGLRFVGFDDQLREDLFLFVEGVVELEPDEEAEPTPQGGKAAPPPPPPSASARTSRAAGMLAQARQLEMQGNIVAAAHVLTRATALDPTDENLWTALRRVEARLAAPRRSSPPEESIDVDVGEFDQPAEPVVAPEELAAIESADRRKCKLLFDAGRDCLETGEVEAAVEYFEKAISADPSFVPLYCTLARVLFEAKGDKERAAHLCRQALEVEPGNDKALALLASFGAE